MSFTILVGDVTPYLREIACRRDSSAYLITADNVQQMHTGTAYVSIGDLKSIKDFFYILSCADCIVYAPPAQWSDNRTITDDYSMEWITVCYINLIASLNRISVENLPVWPFVVLETIKNRKSDNPQLWVAGCSTTYGSGVNIGQRYCDLIKETFNTDLNLLAAPGSSITWARDQILRANIKKK
jgi:hypothetical protein